MFLVGLSGGIASGKTTVSGILKELGIPVIDADQIARDVVKPGKPAWHKIRREFGPEVLLSDGNINRSLLGGIVFRDTAKRKTLNGITHPEIHKEMSAQCIKYLLQGYQFVVLDIPLLYETKALLPYLHKVIVVKCTAEQQLERLMLRNGLSEEEAHIRISAQLPIEQKCAMADFVIDNTMAEELTRAQVEAVVRDLRKLRAHWKIRMLLVCALVGTLLTLTLVSAAVWRLFRS